MSIYRMLLIKFKMISFRKGTRSQEEINIKERAFTYDRYINVNVC